MSSAANGKGGIKFFSFTFYSSRHRQVAQRVKRVENVRNTVRNFAEAPVLDVLTLVQQKVHCLLPVGRLEEPQNAQGGADPKGVAAIGVLVRSAVEASYSNLTMLEPAGEEARPL